MTERELVLSVSIHDCVVETKRGSGKGGQNRNKRDTAVRVYHEPSGAEGQAEDERSQYQNKRTAFLRMIETPQFKAWLSAVSRKIKTPKEIEAQVINEMSPDNLQVEVWGGKGAGWVPYVDQRHDP